MPIALILKSAEVKLMESLGAIDDPAGWHAVDFHLSALLEQYQSEYQIKIAVNLIHDLLKTYEGGIFLLADYSIVVLCKRLEKTLQNKLIFQLRYLYMDDPLAYTEEGEENPEFCTVYDLPRSWQEFWELSSRRMAMSVRKPAGRISATAKAAIKAAAPKPHHPSASRMAKLESELRHADLSRLIRRQPVCAAIPGTSVRRVFDELYIHIASLRSTLKGDADFFSNRWLFKYLTHILDERMIELLRATPGHYLDSPVSLNLNVETLLSSAFAEFDRTLHPAAKVSIVIEVPVMDVFADIVAFTAARHEAQELGYRVCLDGVTADSFLHIDREKLGADLVKVQWNADAPSDIGSPENRALAAAVQAAGTNRVILCRCDNKQAVEFGQALGISLFQGRYLDSLVDPHAEVEN